ncbi:putative permease YjcD [Arthrobacter sp. Hiyo8]|nr:putative permease YjcD [Arthrobacter sp. Hiyo8]
MLKQGSAIDRYFKISERGSNYSREIRGGFATFFAMSYIVVLNPLILSGADSSGASLGFAAVAATTAFVAGILTILMGAWAKHPSPSLPGWASTPSWQSPLPHTPA